MAKKGQAGSGVQELLHPPTTSRNTEQTATHPMDRGAQRGMRNPDGSGLRVPPRNPASAAAPAPNVEEPFPDVEELVREFFELALRPRLRILSVGEGTFNFAAALAEYLAVHEQWAEWDLVFTEYRDEGDHDYHVGGQQSWYGNQMRYNLCRLWHVRQANNNIKSITVRFGVDARQIALGLAGHVLNWQLVANNLAAWQTGADRPLPGHPVTLANEFPKVVFNRLQAAVLARVQPPGPEQDLRILLVDLAVFNFVQTSGQGGGRNTAALDRATLQGFFTQLANSDSRVRLVSDGLFVAGTQGREYEDRRVRNHYGLHLPQRNATGEDTPIIGLRYVPLGTYMYSNLTPDGHGREYPPPVPQMVPFFPHVPTRPNGIANLGENETVYWVFGSPVDVNGNGAYGAEWNRLYRQDGAGAGAGAGNAGRWRLQNVLDHDARHVRTVLHASDRDENPLPVTPNLPELFQLTLQQNANQRFLTLHRARGGRE